MGCNVRVWPRVWSACSQSRGENVRRSQVSERDEKCFPVYHACPKCLAALLCGAAIRKNASASLQVSDEVGMTLLDW